MNAKSGVELSVRELSEVTSGKILSEPYGNFAGLGTDSRKNLSGQLFIALKGDTYDAHSFIPAAIEKGASVLLVHEFRPEWKAWLDRASFVQVADTLTGLQTLARHWRRKNKFKVIAITGSNGKTSTKEFLFTILSPNFKVHASKGSFNNHWGVPLSILEASAEKTHLILEMGMNATGEIFRLCQIAEPDVVTVTTVGRAHMGELGGQEQVAAAKEEIYTASPRAIPVFNSDNEWTMRMMARLGTPQKLVFSAFRPDANVHLRAQRLTWDGLDLVGHIGGVEGRTWVHVMGRHNVVNFMTAAALALAAGLTPEQIWAGLARIKDGAWGRNQRLRLANGAHVLFDGYNANPDSMAALLKNIYEMESPGRKFLIVGDMLELGEFAGASHEELGTLAAGVGFTGIWYVGSMADDFTRGLQKVGMPKVFLRSHDVDAVVSKQFLDMLQPQDLVAIKGSHGLKLERVLTNWPLDQKLGEPPK